MINAIVTFTLTAAAVYFVIVVPINAMRARRKAETAEPAQPVLQRILGGQDQHVTGAPDR